MAGFTHLSRSEVAMLLFDKVSLIEAEAKEIDSGFEGKLSLEKMADAKRRLKRIVIEARRAASLIETYQDVAKAGHCLYCGKTYAEHEDESLRIEDAVRVRAKKDPPAALCYALRKLFESVEVETYQAVRIDPVEI